MAMIKKLLRYQREYGTRYVLDKVFHRAFIKYYFGKKCFPATVSEQERQKQERWQPQKKLKISIVVPLYNTAAVFLKDLIQSVQNQTYHDWELCLADASDKNQEEIERIVQCYQKNDSRIVYKKLSKNEGISINTNCGFEMATGDYIGLADHDDFLHPSALYYVMQEIDGKQADFVYTDELSFVKKAGRVQSIHFKPDFSKESFRNNNYICHFSVFDRRLVAQTGGFRQEFDGSQDYDLFLRLTERANRVCHVAKVLYYWRVHAGSVASEVGAKPYTIEAGRKALEEHLERRGLAAEVEASVYGPFYHVHYQVFPEEKVLIITEDKEKAAQLTKQLSGIPYTIEVRGADSKGEWTKISWVEWDAVIFLRNGYTPLQENGQWITELLGCLQPEENLVAAPVVYDTAEKVYHAGYCYHKDFPEKIRPLYRGLPKSDPGYMNRLAFRQNVSLLGGAALAVKGQVMQQFYHNWQQNGKLTFESLFSDCLWFSICLSAREQGGDCVVTPNSSFVCNEIHKGEYRLSPSIWQQKAWRHFGDKWNKVLERPDPCFNLWMVKFGKRYSLWRH